MNRNSLASAVFTPDNRLFVQISSPTNNLGKIYEITLSSGPTSYDHINSRAMDATNAPNLPTSLIYEDQFVLFPQQPPFPLSVSMSSATQVNLISTNLRGILSTGPRDLFISFSEDSPNGSTGIFRLRSTGSKNHDGVQVGAPWTLVGFSGNSVLQHNTSSILRIASAPTYNGDGSTSIYQLFQDASGSFRLQQVDIYDGSEIPKNSSISIPNLDTSVPPKLLQLSDSSIYSGVVVGRCLNDPLHTCLFFFKDFSNTLPLSTPGMMYDPSNCVADVGGAIVMTDTNQYWKYIYEDYNMSSQWTNGTIGGKNPDNILACAATGGIFYAVSQEDKGDVPDIFVLGTNSSWTWQKPDMKVRPSGMDGESNWGHKLRPFPIGGIIGIVIGVTLVIGAAIYFYYEKKNHDKKMHQLPVYDNNHLDNMPFPSTTTNTTTNTNAAVTLVPNTNANQPGVRMDPRSLSWSNTATVPVDSAIYTNRNSFPVTSSSIPLTTFSTHSSVAPIIATSLIAAPYKPFVIPSTPLPDSENGDTPLIRSNRTLSREGQRDNSEVEAAVNIVHDNGEGSSTGGVNVQRLSNPLYPTPEEENAKAQSRNSRQLDSVLSPTLANAQLILQQSQQPANSQSRLT